jgi:sugar phosphate isomerase/epimerase
MFSRREFGKLALAALPAAALAKTKRINSVFDGVLIGAQSYSFRDRPLDAAIQAIAECGLGECELFQGHFEPRDLKGAALRQWRLTVPLSQMEAIRRKFDDAGIDLFAANISFNDHFSDAEIDRGFQMARAMGVGVISASSTLTAAKRVAPYAEKYKIKVAMHGHSNTRDPNQFATPESFAQAMEMSPYFYVNLDIGHFFAAGYDPVEYIKKHHARITFLHLKDRKKNDGPNVPWGEGDTPIKPVLDLPKANKGWKMPANIEYEYGKPGMDSVVEVKKCVAYCKRALA